MTDIRFRKARDSDLQRIVALLSDDPIGRGRETAAGAVAPEYRAAFEAIQSDGNQHMAVAERNGEIIGCMQITFIPGLSRKGAWRGQLESIRIASSLRGQGIGAAFIKWAIDLCRERGCALVQLTTDQERPDALRFYEALGFVGSHHGLKLKI